jgi:dolichyl-phosphate-mannose-protein mannosyltransferase
MEGIGNSVEVTHQNLNQNPEPIGRWEIVLVCGIVLVGAWLRFAFPERLAVEHFDEGVYASNVWFGESKSKSYPEQHLYAPPVLPVMIECVFLLTGPSNFAAMLPCLIAGSLTPLALWWLGRNWFGAVAGCVAAALCAMSEVHILFSRSALTDVPFGLWWVLAICSLREACNSGRFMSLILAGGYVALAWWTKYNGWMPLGIALGAIVLRGLFPVFQRNPRSWTLTRRSLTRWMIVSTIAVSIWLVWVYGLQSVGGYAAVLANHRRYVVGPAGWLASLERQFAQLMCLGGPLGGLSILGCFCIATWQLARHFGLPEAQSEFASNANATENGAIDQPQKGGSKRPQPLSVLVIVASILTLLGCVWPIIGVTGLSLFALASWARSLGTKFEAADPTETSDLSHWILAVWWVGLFLATPLYHPYLRLTVPWLLANFLAAGLCLQTMVECRLRNQNQNQIQPHSAAGERQQWLPSRRLTSFAFVAFVALATSTYFNLIRNGGQPGCHADRTGLRHAAQEIKKLVAPAEMPVTSISDVAAVYVFAEPALLFQLRLAGVDVVGPAGSLKFADPQRGKPASRTYLAIGIHAKQDPEFLKQFAERDRRFKPVGHWPWHLSPVVSLDQPDSQPGNLGRDPTEFSDVELFELIRD